MVGVSPVLFDLMEADSSLPKIGMPSGRYFSATASYPDVLPVLVPLAILNDLLDVRAPCHLFAL
jgi:hypothetical protein